MRRGNRDEGVKEGAEEVYDEKMYEQLRDVILEILDGDIQLNEVDGTVYLESSDLILTFTDNGEVFEIRNIEVRHSGNGMGARVIEVIAEYAESRSMDLIASNVKDDARNFWRWIGFTEGAESDEYYMAW